jgi:hypothetical protein
MFRVAMVHKEGVVFTPPYPVTDETAITINNQPLGSYRNSLSGRIHKTEQVGDLQITTIYDWTLVKR